MADTRLLRNPAELSELFSGYGYSTGRIGKSGEVVGNLFVVPAKTKTWAAQLDSTPIGRFYRDSQNNIDYRL